MRYFFLATGCLIVEVVVLVKLPGGVILAETTVVDGLTVVVDGLTVVVEVGVVVEVVVVVETGGSFGVTTMLLFLLSVVAVSATIQHRDETVGNSERVIWA